MRKRTKMMVVGACCLLVLALGGALAFYLTRPHLWRDTFWADRALAAMVREEAPLSEAQRQQEEIDAAALANENPEFRKWLVGVVTSDDVDIDIRGYALEVLFEVDEDEAVRDIAAAFLPWMQEGGDSTPERSLQHAVRFGVFNLSILRTDLPAEEILELLERGWPEWRVRREAYVRPKPRAWTSPPSEEEKKRAARYEELLALARSRDEARLMALVQAEAPLPEGKEVKLEDLPRLAEGDPAFRKWLASVVAAVDEDHWVRALAFKALLDMERDEAVRDLMADFHAWFRERDAELNREGRDLQGHVRDLMVDRLLLTDLPLEEVLQIVKRSLPGRWDIGAGAVAAGYGRDQSPWSEEQRARVQQRAKELLHWWKTEPERRAAQQRAAQDP